MPDVITDTSPIQYLSDRGAEACWRVIFGKHTAHTCSDPVYLEQVCELRQADDVFAPLFVDAAAQVF